MPVVQRSRTPRTDVRPVWRRSKPTFKPPSHKKTPRSKLPIEQSNLLQSDWFGHRTFHSIVCRTPFFLDSSIKAIVSWKTYGRLRVVNNLVRCSKEEMAFATYVSIPCFHVEAFTKISLEFTCCWGFVGNSNALGFGNN